MSDEEILEQETEVDEMQEEETATNSTVDDSADSEETIESLKLKLEQAEKKATDNWDQLLRIKADMDNLRRRTQRDLENAHKFAIEKFVAELLPVMDSMELGLDAAAHDSSTIESLKEGTELTLNMLKSALQKFNIVEIHPHGEQFDPELHQAMSIQESAEMEHNTVMAVMQKGYLLNDRLVRPAMVMVSKAPAENSEES
ncbi:MAG: nucleotide exchange factor GrpE [Gammaproteobacteria bacterium]|nr:nucleotide exchange factor GrpE [Gammaproteobacteria bacterium]MCW8911326.1 nucleotide exchange factor GrpE [Gammaproteobacteria bacterium]MCW9004982.1 nucleotide exchange factor GrpE [Gammaproteobacteria bacterium]